MGTNASELGRTIRALTLAGRIETVDSAMLQAARSLASAVDKEPDNAQLWRQYREAVKDLTRYGKSDNDSIDKQLARLFSQANVGDEEKA